jgi:hypothetical protein
LSLGDEHAIEGVGVMKGEMADRVGVAEIDG